MGKFHLIFLLLFSANLYALPLSITNRPHFSFNQVGTLDACGVYKKRRDSINCNPGNFKNSAYEGMLFHLTTKTDGDSVETGKNLIFEPITQEDLKEIFELNSFSSWDANSMIEFRTKLFYLSYEPIYASANFLLYNPAFPEVSVNLSSQRRINLTVGEEFKIGKGHIFSIGTNIHYFERNYFSGSFALLDVTGGGTDDLIDFKKTSGINLDIGFIYENTNSTYFPIIAFQSRNIGAIAEVDEDKINSETFLEPILLYETYHKLDIGYDLALTYGSIGFSSSLPYNDDFTKLYGDYITHSVSYSLWDFEIMGATSRYTDMLAVKFASDMNAIGIYFGSSKALGNFLEKKEQFAGVTLEIYL